MVPNFGAIFHVYIVKFFDSANFLLRFCLQNTYYISLLAFMFATPNYFSVLRSFEIIVMFIIYGGGC